MEDFIDPTKRIEVLEKIIPNNLLPYILLLNIQKKILKK